MGQRHQSHSSPASRIPDGQNDDRRPGEHCSEGLRTPFSCHFHGTVDLKAAFDRVWENGLLRDLARLKIHPTALRWLRAFVADRKAAVRWDNTISRFRTFKEGVPQGSPLSPLLFLRRHRYAAEKDLQLITRSVGRPIRRRLYHLGVWLDSSRSSSSPRPYSPGSGEVVSRL